MISIEEELQEYERAASLEGIKVFDSSALHSQRRKESDFYSKETETSRSTRIFMYLEDIAEANIVYPIEVVNEFNQRIIKARRLSNKLSRTSRKPRNSRKASQRYTERENAKKAIGDEFNRFVRSCKSFKEFMLSYPAEELIGSDEWEKGILSAVEEVAARPGIKRSYLRTDGVPKGLEENKHNDQRIFAKAFDISNNSPVYIITRDLDFVRMRQEFYRYMEQLSTKYSFAIPKYRVRVHLLNIQEFI